MPGQLGQKVVMPSRRTDISHEWFSDPAIEAETERLLSGRTRDIRLTGDMLRLYEHTSWPQRSKIVRAWAIWVAIIGIVFVPISYLLVPNVFLLSIVMGFFLVPAAQIALYLIWSKPRHAWVEGLSVVAIISLSVIGFASVGAASHSVNSERILTSAIYFATIAIVVLNVRLVWSAAIACCTIVIFFTFEMLNPAIDMHSVIGCTAYYAMGMFAVVAARRTALILSHKGFLMSLRDRYRSRALTQANEMLENLATRDPLTSLANRRFASDGIAEIWRDTTIDKAQVAFIMADIDQFKLLNDTAGHAAGDECIRRVARTIETVSRPGDIVCRYGGEEFLIVLKEVLPAQAWLLAERIRSDVEALAIVNPGLPDGSCVTISLGVAFAELGASPELVVKWADDALYDAKRTGRNRAFMTRLGPFDEAETAAAMRQTVPSLA